MHSRLLESVLLRAEVALEQLAGEVDRLGVELAAAVEGDRVRAVRVARCTAGRSCDVAEGGVPVGWTQRILPRCGRNCGWVRRSGVAMVSSEQGALGTEPARLAAAVRDAADAGRPSGSRRRSAAGSRRRSRDRSFRPAVGMAPLAAQARFIRQPRHSWSASLPRQVLHQRLQRVGQLVARHVVHQVLGDCGCGPDLPLTQTWAASTTLPS